MTTVKSTVYLNKYYKEQLEYLVRSKHLASVTDGINLAIEEFVKKKKREIYAQQMTEASRDRDFLERTMASQNDFDNISDEVDGEW